MKALRLYNMMTFNLIFAIPGTALMILLAIALALSPEGKGSEDYMSMIGTVGIGHLGIIFINFSYFIQSGRYKFPASIRSAKLFFTVVPVVAVGSLCLIYDIFIIVISAIVLPPSVFSDILISNAVHSVVACFLISLSGKKKFYFITLPLMFIYFFQTIILSHLGILSNGFGLPLAVAAVISAAIYIIGTGLNLGLLNWWWKKSGRDFNVNVNTAYPGI